MSDNKNLTFGLGNAKLSKAIVTFSLPAGWTCPFARECLSKADRKTGKIIDGKHCRFRCFAASQDALYPNVRAARWRNFDLLRSSKTVENMANLIQRSLPWGLTIVRIHVSGDYFNENYFLAWLNVACNNPFVTFYGYTKANPYLVKYKKYIPPNFRLTASLGGTCDNLIIKHKLKSAEVVFSTEEARRKGLEIDHDDSHAFSHSGNFALLLYGTQPPGTEASKAWRALLKEGIGGYNETTKSRRIIFTRPIILYVTLKNKEVFLPEKQSKWKYIPLISEIIK